MLLSKTKLLCPLTQLCVLYICRCGLFFHHSVFLEQVNRRRRTHALPPPPAIRDFRTFFETVPRTVDSGMTLATSENVNNYMSIVLFTLFLINSSHANLISIWNYPLFYEGFPLIICSFLAKLRMLKCNNCGPLSAYAPLSSFTRQQGEMRDRGLPKFACVITVLN